MAKASYLVVGQGIAGSLLAHGLSQRGFRVHIIDPCVSDTASMKAAGLYNPVTGRKMNLTWMAHKLFHGLKDYYDGVDAFLSIHSHHSLPIYRPFLDQEEQNDWQGRTSDARYEGFIRRVHSESLQIAGLKDPFGGLELQNCGYVDLPSLIEGFRKHFMARDIFIKGRYPQDAPTHDRVIFCDGPSAVENPYWANLPFQLVRGETIDIQCTLPEERIYNRGVFIIPRKDHFRIGSTYHHDVLCYSPQERGIKELRDKLAKLYTGSYEFVQTSAGVRPATFDRKPFIGWHPENKDVGIFNGFGAKGVSLVPYFSKLFVDSIEEKASIHPEADVSRVF
jgi:glycine/D-amino acid oxidase-like deaminating enzyme